MSDKKSETAKIEQKLEQDAKLVEETAESLASGMLKTF
jgi:hypothetical protein